MAARVLDADGCTPLEDAVFEIWHCDASGLYSGFEAASRGAGSGGGSGAIDTTRYLRGAQVTNADGPTLTVSEDGEGYLGLVTLTVRR